MIDTEQAERLSEFLPLLERLLFSYGLELQFSNGEIKDMIKGSSFPCHTNRCCSYDGEPFSCLVLGDTNAA